MTNSLWVDTNFTMCTGRRKSSLDISRERKRNKGSSSDCRCGFVGSMAIEARKRISLVRYELFKYLTHSHYYS